MISRTEIALRLAAGAVFGLFTGHLLYFLNPQISVTVSRLAISSLIYASICALFFGSILVGIRFVVARIATNGSPHAGFGFTVVATFLSAVMYWSHLTILRIYLPRGAVRVLSKATSLIGALAFILLILWLIERGSSRRNSRLVITTAYALLILSAMFLYQRRDRYREAVAPRAAASLDSIPQRRPLIFIAIRDLPYDWLLTIEGEGGSGFFARTRASSFVARLEPFRTTSPKALWASLATGKLPYRHGVTGRFSYRTLLNGPEDAFLLVPSWIGFKGWGLIPPVERISAPLPSGEALAFWEIAAKVGGKPLVVNWAPSDRSAGTEWFVGDRFVRDRDSTDIVPRSAAPAAVRLLIRPAELERRFLLRVRSLPADTRASAVASLTGDASALRIATALSRDESADFVVVALNGLSTVIEETGTGGGNQLPEPGTQAGDLVRAYLEELDRLLEDVASESAGSTLVIASPSGPEPPILPLSWLAAFRFAQELQSPGEGDGFVMVRGPLAVKPDQPPTAELVDVVPTILYAFGAPLARDLDGRVLTEAFHDDFLRRHPMSLVSTYESAGSKR